MRVEAAARRRKRIGPEGFAFLLTGFVLVRLNPVLCFLVSALSSRAAVSSAGGSGVVTVAGSGRTRMKIFVGGEPLREQLRAVHCAILIDNQTAIGFVVKEHLRDSKDDERIKSAANDCQDQGGEDCAANFRKECL